MRSVVAGIALIAVGAAVTWSVSPSGSGVRATDAGIGLLAAGAAALLVGLVRGVR